MHVPAVGCTALRSMHPSGSCICGGSACKRRMFAYVWLSGVSLFKHVMWMRRGGILRLVSAMFRALVNTQTMCSCPLYCIHTYRTYRTYQPITMQNNRVQRSQKRSSWPGLCRGLHTQQQSDSNAATKESRSQATPRSSSWRTCVSKSGPACLLL